MINLVLFGPPGVGKGTQASKLIDKYKLLHLSTGDLLRGEISSQTKLGIEAKNYMEKGELVPDAVVIGMIDAKLNHNKSAKGFIFDGFPRTVAQAQALDTLLVKNGLEITIMISLEAEHNVLVERLLLRGTDSGREDDQDVSIIENRIKVYNKETSPVKYYYNSLGKYQPVNGVGEVDDIFQKICTYIDKV